MKGFLSQYQLWAKVHVNFRLQSLPWGHILVLQFFLFCGLMISFVLDDYYPVRRWSQTNFPVIQSAIYFLSGFWESQLGRKDLQGLMGCCFPSIFYMFQMPGAQKYSLSSSFLLMLLIMSIRSQFIYSLKKQLSSQLYRNCQNILNNLRREIKYLVIIGNMNKDILQKILYEQKCRQFDKQSLTAMILPENFVDIFSASLRSGDHLFLDKHVFLLLNPVNLARVLEAVSNVHISFALCLALKQTIKRNNKKSSILTSTLTRKQSREHLKRIQIIAELTPLLQKCQKERVQQTSFHDDQYQFFNGQEQEQRYGCYLQGKIKDQNKIIWYESVNHFYLILQSLKQSYLITQFCQDDAAWYAGTIKLQDQIIAKLIISCLLYQDGNDQGYKLCLQMLMKQIQLYLPRQQQIVGERLSNILQQMAYYINTELLDLDKVKMQAKYGNNFIKQIIAVFYRLIKFNSRATIISVIEALYQISKLNNYFIARQELSDRIQIQQAIFNEQERVPSFVSKNMNQIIKLSTDAISFVFSNNMSWAIITKISKILKLLTLSIINSLDESFSYVQVGKANKSQLCLAKIFDCLAVIVEELIHKIQAQNQIICLQNSSDYLNFQITLNVMKIVYSHINFAIKEKRVLQFMCKRYFFMLIERTSIQMGNGLTNPITLISLFLYKIHTYLKLSDDFASLKLSVEQIFKQILNRFVNQQYVQQFTCYKQQKILASSYFKGVELLFEQLSKNAYKQSQDTYFYFYILYKYLDAIFTNNQTKGHYFIRFALEIARATEDSRYIYNREQKYKLLLYLLDKLRLSSFKKEYLMLLNIVTDQLIDQSANQFDETLSYLWYSIKRNSNFSLKEFSNNLATQVINFLFKEKQQYFASFSIYILCRTSKKIAAVQVNRRALQQSKYSVKTNDLYKKQHKREQSIIKTYLSSVYDFFTNIQKSSLHQLGVFEQRIQFFQMIGLLGIKSLKDVYTIFNQTIFKSFNCDMEGKYLYFMADSSGLLQAELNVQLKQIILELIIITINQNQQILQYFSNETLQNNKKCFDVFYSFTCRILQSCLNFKNKQHSSQIIIFINALFKKLNQLYLIYDTDNFQQLTQMYAAFVKLNMPHISLPLLPQKIYNTSQSLASNLILRYTNNLLAVQSSEQVYIIFQNTFERSMLNWQAFESAQVQSQIFAWQKMPELLLEYVDYLQSSNTPLFFDYNKLIKKIALMIYSSYEQKLSLSFSDRQSFIDTYGDDSQLETQPIISKTEQFFRQKYYVMLLKKLAEACHSFIYIESGNHLQYLRFEEQFFKQFREILNSLNV